MNAFTKVILFREYRLRPISDPIGDEIESMADEYLRETGSPPFAIEIRMTGEPSGWAGTQNECNIAEIKELTP